MTPKIITITRYQPQAPLTSSSECQECVSSPDFQFGTLYITYYESHLNNKSHFQGEFSFLFLVSNVKQTEQDAILKDKLNTE